MRVGRLLHPGNIALWTLPPQLPRRIPACHLRCKPKQNAVNLVASRSKQTFATGRLGREPPSGHR